jgi:hypothetical protein
LGVVDLKDSRYERNISIREGSQKRLSRNAVRLLPSVLVCFYLLVLLAAGLVGRLVHAVLSPSACSWGR